MVHLGICIGYTQLPQYSIERPQVSTDCHVSQNLGTNLHKHIGNCSSFGCHHAPSVLVHVNCPNNEYVTECLIYCQGHH